MNLEGLRRGDLRAQQDHLCDYKLTQNIKTCSQGKGVISKVCMSGVAGGEGGEMH